MSGDRWTDAFTGLYQSLSCLEDAARHVDDPAQYEVLQAALRGLRNSVNELQECRLEDACRGAA